MLWERNIPFLSLGFWGLIILLYLYKKLKEHQSINFIEGALELDKKESKPGKDGKTEGIPDSKDDEKSTDDDTTEEDGGTESKKRYFASTELDPLRFTSQAGQIGENIVAHLQAHKDAKVKITIDIQAGSDVGFSDDIVRTVSENSNALDINQHGFEDE